MDSTEICCDFKMTPQVSSVRDIIKVAHRFIVTSISKGMIVTVGVTIVHLSMTQNIDKAQPIICKTGQNGRRIDLILPNGLSIALIGL